MPMRSHSILFIVVLFSAFFTAGIQLRDRPPFEESFILLAAAIQGAIVLAALLFTRLVPARCLKTDCGVSTFLHLRRSGTLVYVCKRCGREDASGLSLAKDPHIPRH